MDAIERYFELNSAAWLDQAYHDKPHSYPTARHRLRLSLGVLKPLARPGALLLELACGGAHLSAEAAKLGFRAVAVDQSSAMLTAARERIGKLPAEARAR